jgi:hypothetical protein
MKRLIAAVLGTAAATYFLDPDQGRRRRNTTRDRVTGFFRRETRKTERAMRHGSSYAHGMVARAEHAMRGEQPPGDDRTLAHKVETILFRPADAPKGHVNIDAVDGIVTLRGQVERVEQIRELEEKARAINGVRDVENLLHTP